MSLRGLAHASGPRRETEAAPRHGSGPAEAERDEPGVAAPWEIRLAWLLRALILATAAFHLLEGAVLYGLLCFGALTLILAPSLLARSSRLTIPVEIELFVLWWLVTDMTLGRLLDLYGTLPFYDKLIHFGNSGLLAIISFLAIYALRMTCRIRTGFVLNLTAIFLLTLGAGALWEIAEFGADATLGAGAQGSPVMAPLDDTMWDLIVDGLGGLLGGLFGALYMRRSKRSLALESLRGTDRLRMRAKESTIRGCELRHAANCGRSQGSTLPGAGELEEMIAFGGFAAASAAGRAALAAFGDGHRRYMAEVPAVIPTLSVLAGSASRAGTQHW